MNAAELMGWSDRVGEIAAGKFADIIAVAADPLQDTSLQHVGFVMKGATAVKNEMVEKKLNYTTERNANADGCA